MAISTRCAHLGCPVRYIQASQRFVCPCHGGVYDFEGKVDGGPPVRPLDRFYTRVRNGRVQVGERFSVNSELERFSPRDPSNHLDGLVAVPLPVEAQHMSKLTRPLPKSLRPPRARRGPPRRENGDERQARPRRDKLKEGAAEGGAARRRLARRAHRRQPAPARLQLYRKVPKGTNWFYTLGSATLFAFVSQAVTGVFLAMYYNPDPVARLRVRGAHHQRGLPRRAGARHAPLGRHGDDHPDLPAHGQDVRVRRLQVPARAELDHRRDPAGAHAGDGPHRLPAARSTSAPSGRRSWA